MANQVDLSTGYYPNPTIGRPLSSANIYVGVIDLDPEVPANQKQISVLQENGTTINVSQPITTSAGGVPQYNGSPVTILVDGSYSLKVTDKSGSQIYYVPKNVEGLDNLLEGLQPVDNIAALSAITFAPEDGQIVNVLGYYLASENEDWKFKWDSSDLSAKVTDDPLKGIYVPLDSDPTGATGAFVRLYERGYFNARWFGAKFDNSWDDTTGVQRAINYTGNNGSVEISGTPVFTAPIVFPTSGIGIKLYSKKRTTISCNHNGDGIVLNALNENYGGHVLENITLDGPNVHFPTSGSYVPPSTGSGIVCEVSYDNTFINAKSFGFLNGIRVKTGFNNKCVGDCAFMFNQYGVFIDGGATNLNHFDGARIRQNRKQGVRIDGSAGAPYPTMNSFVGAYIETNVPYEGGYPSGGPGDGTEACGVWLDSTYDNNFTGVYFENQEYDFWLTGASSGNIFDKTRHAPGGGRYGKIMFDGANVNDNKAIGAIYVSSDTTTPSVESNNATQSGNSFIECRGFNFIDASLTKRPTVINNLSSALINGTPDGSLSYPDYGYMPNPTEGTTRGKIDGVGTTTATLNAQGLSEFYFGSGITADTTITAFSNLKKHSILTLINNQVAHTVTIKSSGVGTGALLLNGLIDVQLTDYGQTITFLSIGLGKVIEIGRNFAVGQKGTTSISDAATSVVVSLPVDERNLGYKALITQYTQIGAPPVAARRVWVSSKTASSFTIFAEAAPGAGNTVYIDWLTVSDY